MTEFQTTISKLKNNKAVGPDRIPNEFIKHVTNEIKEIILKFLNLNLKVGITAENLCQNFITVIHKDGKKNDPDIYRRICIANSILKILSSLLEARLKEFGKKHNTIDKAQIGFQENARTSDHILTFKTTPDHILTLKTTSDHILTLKTTSDHILTLKTTSDHILTLKTIINKYVTDQKGKKLYSCFIDFKKAFDSVWHIGLFRKHSIVSGSLAC